MIRNGEASLDAAAERLRRAVDALEAGLAAQAARPVEPQRDPAAEEALHIQLREARHRERALEGAAAEASTVLGRAADRIRAALDDEDAALSEAAQAQSAVEADDQSASLDHLSDDQTDLHPHQREF
ncbi:MAG: hypothetical protein KY446_01445 [Proteobacteria bacterium]|nr:hypothetical protein [Pseudomonadota bacterium]MBW3616406.1 hypothetical protein [Pseudomonadota bacterium]